MNKLPLILFFIISDVFADAEDRMKEGVNYCHDKQAVNSNSELLANNPNDPLIIKLTALRVGLCKYVDENKISLQQAIDIFSDEKNKAIVERTNEELREHPKPVL